MFRVLAQNRCRTPARRKDVLAQVRSVDGVPDMAAVGARVLFAHGGDGSEVAAGILEGRLAEPHQSLHVPGAQVLLGGIDNRGSHFYLALYWAQELSKQAEDAELAAAFAPVSEKLAANEQKIVAEFGAVQGKPVDIGGYYLPDFAKLDQVMRPSATLNKVLAAAA